MTETALDGIVIAEVGSRIGAGVCGSLLAQLGATVVFVERKSDAPFGAGKQFHRQQLAAGKLSFAPNAGDAEDLRLLDRLLERADATIVSTDVDGEVARRIGAQRRGEQILCDITAFGATGPLANRPATELQIQALSGMMDTTGLAEGPPVPVMLPIVEYMTGAYGAAAILAALRVRRQSGVGQAIDMSLYDCAFAAMTSFLPFVLENPDAEIRRIGNRHALASPWNVYEARDGWVLLCAGSNVQWQRLCEVMGRPELATAPEFAKVAGRVARTRDVDAAVQAWIGGLTVEEAVARLSSGDIASGPIATIDDYPREANLDFRGMVRERFDPVEGRNVFVPASALRLSRTPGQAPTAIPARDADRETVRALSGDPPNVPPAVPARGKPQLPLAGLRVIEIGHYTTAPLSARHLANLGADVIKVEQPEGEATRSWAPLKWGQGVFFSYTNADKRSLTLDLRTPAGAETLRRLIETSDVLIENLKPGALAKRGFSWAEMARINPRLIYCAVSGFGADSLYAGRPAFDTVVQAMSGVMDAIRTNGVPVKTGISSADLIGAESAVIAVLAALEYRERAGVGQHIDLSMQDAAAWITQTLWNGADKRLPAPAVLACADGFVVADSQPGEASWSGKSRDQAVAEIERSGIAAAPVLTVREIIGFPQTEARRLWFEAEDEGRPWWLLSSPMRLSETPPVVARPMAGLGRDNAAILEELGMAEAVGGS